MAEDSSIAPVKRFAPVKRVASGAGEGSVVVQAIHQFLNPCGA